MLTFFSSNFIAIKSFGDLNKARLLSFNSLVQKTELGVRD